MPHVNRNQEARPVLPLLPVLGKKGKCSKQPEPACKFQVGTRSRQNQGHHIIIIEQSPQHLRPNKKKQIQVQNRQVF